MEKSTCHCKLSVVRALIEAGHVRATTSALIGAKAAGFDLNGMVGVVLSLGPHDFYKSMTTHADHRVWQDVYQTRTVAAAVYLKLTVVDDVLVVSFKEL